ncbi:MAG: fumarate hydratase C-terminal domain-containing protein [Lachnospiraceae bacterium]|nr:fumarate hydratase C-terminal domain-containing protein [Lachnospiraceae bacterium]MBR4768407.1 fumarate hydratase C-terminal domain-containing protein [Lachnospiraceae bacterium]
MEFKTIQAPFSEETIRSLKVGDIVNVSGRIFAGRDAVLPKIVKMIEEGTLEKNGIDLTGGVIFHTAVSPAGVGPTSSNKLEIEGTMPELTRAGIRMHLGKGELKKETIEMFREYGAVYAVIAPVTALLNSKVLSRKCLAHPELGMEAFYELTVDKFPCIIAAANGKSIFDKEAGK